MNEMSEKPIHRVVGVVSMLALAYYTVTSINYIRELNAQYSSYETTAASSLNLGQLETRNIKP